MICPDCGFENDPDATRCGRCGAHRTAADGSGPAGGAPAESPPASDPGGSTLVVPAGADSPANLDGSTVGVSDAGAPPTDSEGSTVAYTGPPPSGSVGWSRAVDPGASGAGQTSVHVGALLAGRYEILRLLGEGGMGAVYHARDAELERPVALKLIRPDLASHPEALQRFKQELILAREVTHPNVVRIFDLATVGSLKFITMEFVEGRDLKAMILEDRKFTTDETVDVARQICLALKAAHEAGIVHRDLKPQNIMLDREGRVKVMDFGVARSMEQPGMTRTGQLIGTPDYMSPEQAKGEPVDARSDLFSFGVILYELLIGKVPYQADTTFGLLLKRTQEPAVPPVKHDAHVPMFLNDVVVRCLQIERDDRYQTSQEIIDDLDARQATRAMLPLARIRSRIRRISPFARWAALVAAAAALGLIAMVTSGRLSLTERAAGTVDAAPEVEPVSLAILPFQNATGDPSIDWLQASLAEMLRSDVGQSAHLRTVPSDRVHQILSDLKLVPSAGLDEATIARLADHSNAEMVVSGQYTKIAEQIRIDATLHDLAHGRSSPVKAEAAGQAGLIAAIGELAGAIREKMELSAAALEELEAASFAPSTESIEALRFYNESLRLTRQGNYVEAIAALEASVAADPGFALGHARLGQAYGNLGRDGDAERASRLAVELSEGLPTYEHNLIAAAHAEITNDRDQAIASYERLLEAAPDDPEISFHLAGLYEQEGDFDEMRERLEKVLKYDPNYVDALYALGRVEIRLGEPQKALDPLNRGLTLCVQADNEDGRGRILNAIGIAYRFLGNQEEALRYYEQSLEIRRRLDQKGGIANSLSEIAMIQSKLGQPDQARAGLEEALALRREIGDRAGIAGSLFDLGNLYLDQGRSDDALGNFKESLRIQREIGDERQEALCLNNIGGAYLDRGEFGDALTNLEQALRLREKAKIPEELGETLFNLGETTSRLGQYPAALDYYLRALEQMRAAQDELGVAASHYGIGNILAFQGRFGAALDSQREALDTLEAAGEKGTWRVVVTARYGAALGAVGRFEEAQTVLETAATLAAELRNQVQLARVEIFRGDNRVFQGELDAAASDFERALAQAQAANDPETTIESRLNLAKIRIRQGRPGEVVQVLRSLSQEADRLGVKHLAAQSAILLGEALLAQGDARGARDQLQGTLNVLERSQLRPLLATCQVLLARVDKKEGNADGASRHYAQARRLLDEIREEGGERNPLLRRDLAALYDEAGAG